MNPTPQLRHVFPTTSRHSSMILLKKQKTTTQSIIFKNILFHRFVHSLLKICILPRRHLMGKILFSPPLFLIFRTRSISDFSCFFKIYCSLLIHNYPHFRLILTFHSDSYFNIPVCLDALFQIMKISNPIFGARKLGSCF
jgi:hypothetical protein